MHFDHSYAKNLTALVTPMTVSPLSEPQLQLYNQPLAEQLELDPSFSEQSHLFTQLFSSQGALNQHAVAQKYGGHQFGGWNPELGDGRGLLLAEVVTHAGQRWDLHLKGAGKTPYSRFGDGRAVLRSTIREYLASEALHHLGIPTSRALCLVSSSEPVYREKQETGAMLIRACQSHLRFGHFEYFYHSKQLDKLDALFEYALQYHFSACREHANPHQEMLRQVVLSTADMIAKWQSFGFCHGVMNSDNMSIHGITFDFGPYAFLDNFDSQYICNHSDHGGRYAYDQQPGVALWNLNALAHSFTPYLSIDEIKHVLAEYEPRLLDQYASLMRLKLGLHQPQEDDLELVNGWLSMLEQDKRDFSQSFRLLCNQAISENQFVDHFIDRQRAKDWFVQYRSRLAIETLSAESRQLQMQQVNPKYILRNYLAQIAIDRAEEGDFSECEQLLKVLANPFDEQNNFQSYAATPPSWGQDMEISCSS
ncbi:protein adenylyltransferase SelO [Aliiglaciecola sp. LCG003]|uniref:protein adenylyltransferase SelO n=1 Tax=Aliiglaciecola sp. LCG003 TaxID=3053655 RepID=UPI0025726AAC|nr:YdiU family protein [Aliiglaciecola sp. LCG003]WJG09634.1 YdiU family protein [Aliiglaciecola sp. LCG003]